MSEIMTASREWASRPDDQRYLTLQELYNATLNRRNTSWTAAADADDLRVVADEESDRLSLVVRDHTAGRDRMVQPTHWSFGQLAGAAGLGVTDLRKLPAFLAGANLQWMLENRAAREETLVLGSDDGSMRSLTSTSYGRIWDSQVVEAVMKANADGRWVIPSASYATTNPLRATTLYASDRDVFLFLVDPKNPVEFNGEQLFRGFYAWNSEVGKCVFGLCTFLYRYACDNRIIWGASQVRELRIRHTSGAPERFAYEGAKYLRQYANESTQGIVAGIQAAQNLDIIKRERKKDEKVPGLSWLQSRGFTKKQAQGVLDTATAEMGQARSLWDIVNGVTAYARAVPHTDERVALEAKAGDLMNLIAA